MLTPVINKEVSHIQSMILRQKHPKSKGARSRLRPAPMASNYQRPLTNGSCNLSRQSYGSNYRKLSGEYCQQQSPPSLFKLNLPSSTSQSQTKNSGYQTSPPHVKLNLPSSTGKSQIRKSDYAATSPPLPMKAKTEEFFLPPSVTQKLLQIVRDDQGQSIQKFEASIGTLHPHIAGIFPNIEDLIRSLKSLNTIGGCVYLPNETGKNLDSLK